MNNELYEVIKAYATKPHKELATLLLDKSKDQLIALFNGLITIYINDKIPHFLGNTSRYLWLVIRLQILKSDITDSNNQLKSVERLSLVRLNRRIFIKN